MHAHVSNKEIPVLRSVFCRVLDSPWHGHFVSQLYSDYKDKRNRSLLEINRIILWNKWTKPTVRREAKLEVMGDQIRILITVP